MIYLASPYNDPDPAVRQSRYEACVAALTALLHDGQVVFSPIVYHHPVVQLRDLGRGFEFWRRIDTEFLRRCDELVILQLQGWATSKGVREERWLAQALGIPIRYFRWEGTPGHYPFLLSSTPD